MAKGNEEIRSFDVHVCIILYVCNRDIDDTPSLIQSRCLLRLYGTIPTCRPHHTKFSLLVIEWGNLRMLTIKLKMPECHRRDGVYVIVRPDDLTDVRIRLKPHN